VRCIISVPDVINVQVWQMCAGSNRNIVRLASMQAEFQNDMDTDIGDLVRVASALLAGHIEKHHQHHQSIILPIKFKIQ